MSVINNIYLVDYTENKASFFSKKLYKALDPIALTDDETLNRILLSRCEIDLGNVKNEYEKIFGKSLRNAVAVNPNETMISLFPEIHSFSYNFSYVI